jgi:hypothetical protein
VIPISWRNRTHGEAKLKIKEMGSRYFFICMYVWLEKYFSRGDYRKVRVSAVLKNPFYAGSRSDLGRIGLILQLPSMIYLLGGSGYVGGKPTRRSSALKKGMPFRNLRRAEVDYTDAATLRGAPPARQARVPDQRRRLHRQAQRRRLRAPQGRVPARQRRAARGRRRGLRGRRRPLGPRLLGLHLQRGRAGRRGFTEDWTPRTSPSARTTAPSTAAPRASARRSSPGRPSLFVWRLRIPFDSVDNPRNYLTKLMRYPAPRGHQLDLPARRVRGATFACWEKRVPFGTYNVTNPGRVTTHEVVELIRALGRLHEGILVLLERGGVHADRGQDAAVQLRPGLLEARAAGIRLTPVHEAVERDLKAWRKAA